MTKKTTAQRRRRLHSNRKHSRSKLQIVKITRFIEFFDINVASETQSGKLSKNLISNSPADLCRARRSVKFRKTCEFQEGGRDGRMLLRDDDQPASGCTQREDRRRRLGASRTADAVDGPALVSEACCDHRHHYVTGGFPPRLIEGRGMSSGVRKELRVERVARVRRLTRRCGRLPSATTTPGAPARRRRRGRRRCGSC